MKHYADEEFRYRSTRAMGEVALDSMRAWEAVRDSVSDLPPVSRDNSPVATKGSTKHKLLRVLMPVHTVLDIFRNYRYDVYQDKYIVSAPLESLTTFAAWRLKIGGATPTSLDKVAIARSIKRTNAVGQNVDVKLLHVEIKHLELRLNYEDLIQRLAFKAVPMPKNLPRDEAVKRHKEQIFGYMDSWIKFIESEKLRQMGIADSEQWPKMKPWKMDSMQTMPIVVWFQA